MAKKIRRIGNVDYSKNLTKKVFGKRFRSILAQIIVNDIKDGLKSSKDINNKPFKKLKASTARQKRKDGYTTKPLIRTGMMKTLPPVTDKTKHAEISVAAKRTPIGVFHNEGGDKPNRPPKREWFGVSKRAKQKMARAIGKRVVGILKKDFKL
jgi:hypothetical protein